MAKMTSAVKHSYDVDPKVLFRALGSAAVTADGGSDVLSIHALTAAYWQTDGEVADKRFDVVIVVEATTVTNAIALKLQVDDADDMGSAVDVFSLSDPAVGTYTIPVDADQLEALIANPSHVRMYVDLGASDSINYSAWIVPSAKA
jgi:hypothetical protein